MTQPLPLEAAPTVLPLKEEIVELEVLRFSRLNRILHVSMIVSFMSLALTGMTLKFSYTRWAGVVSRFFGGFESAGCFRQTTPVIFLRVKNMLIAISSIFFHAYIFGVF